ncbi:MAG TPA: aminotransferase class IV [Gammaproteobacteria bacterium]|nr:aminotransferase class IV [Gammaproteobacteria bacterium]
MAGLQSMTNVDGVITPTADARVPVLDRGFLYGDSIYEVFRTYEGVPLFYDEHWARLENSASLIRLKIGLSLAEVTEAIRATVAATGAPRSRTDVYVRYVVTRGEGPVDLFPSPDLKSRYVIIVRSVPNWGAELYARGVRVAIAQTLRNPSRALDPNIKGGNYLNNVLGVMDARAVGADDCIMLNEAGFVTEASNSNVFFVVDDRLVTPGQTAANLRGLTKAAIHEACKARGLESDEVDVAAADLTRATECFVSSATREVMPVASLRLLDGSMIAFPEGGGPVTRRVAAYYKEYVAEYVRAHAHLSLF